VAGPIRLPLTGHGPCSISNLSIRLSPLTCGRLRQDDSQSDHVLRYGSEAEYQSICSKLAEFASIILTTHRCVLAPPGTSEQTMYDRWPRFIEFLLCWILLGVNLLRLNVQDWIEWEKPK
jgi:hypothetical protein